MSTPFPDPARVKTLWVRWTMEAAIDVQHGGLLDAQGQPREPELLDEATLLELAKQVIGPQMEVDLPRKGGGLILNKGRSDERRTDYKLLACLIKGDIMPC